MFLKHCAKLLALAAMAGVTHPGHTLTDGYDPPAILDTAAHEAAVTTPTETDSGTPERVPTGEGHRQRGPPTTPHPERGGVMLQGAGNWTR